MAISPTLDLRQAQGLVMTPQLQQAIKLLQLNNMEVAAFVETELEQNPMLERDEGQNDRDRGELDREQAFRETERASAETGDSHDLLQPNGLTETSSSPLDSDYSNTYDGDIAGPGAAQTPEPSSFQGEGESQYWSQAGAGGRRDFDGNGGDFDQSISEDMSLRDHLLAQLSVDLRDEQERMIGAALIDMLDDNGWMSAPLDQVSEMLGCETDLVEAVLQKMQEFDPPGIFARTLQECLSIQLRDLDRLDPAMQALIDNLDVLAARDAKSLQKLCGVDQEDLVDMVAEIRALNPRPAAAFETFVAQPVTPDVLMRRTEDGSWLVELNPESLPRVLVNDSYFAKVSKTTRSKEETEYLTERYQTANWLVKSLHQRATTIIRVASEIVRQQHGFFEHGVSHLRPLVLRDIAEAIEMHESTVSRVTSNKYISSPRGLFELKFFFTSAIGSTAGSDQHSAESVRHRIRTLIGEESPEAILSDDKLVEILRSEGIDIARRTVAKYREAMKISSSVQRRREKRGSF